MGWGWWRARWWIGPKLRGRSLLTIWRQSPRKPLVTHYAVMIEILQCKVSLLEKTHVEACPGEHLNDSEMAWGEMTQGTPSPQSSTDVETCFEAVFLLRVHNDFTSLRSQWMRPCTEKPWTRTSVPQPEHWRLWMDSSVTVTINLRP